MSALQVAKLAKSKRVGGVPGLELRIKNDGDRSWVLNFRFAGRDREMGLGPFPEVTLGEARERARKARLKAREGIDPIIDRKAARSALQASTAAAKTFRQCALAFIDSKAPEFKNAKHLAQWSATLETYAFPVMGSVMVRDVALPHIQSVLEPIWITKTETATRVRGRIEAVLDWATASGYRSGDNPARWRGHLDKLLPKPKKVKRVIHHPALKASEMGPFMKRLRGMEGIGARALEFAALTAARSGEVRGATWSEIANAAKVWTIPAERMKADKEHRVPLSEPAMALLASLPRFAGTDLVFPAPRGGMLSDMTLSACMRRMKLDAVPHGLRSTFRDWAGEHTNYPREVAEAALAHVVGGVEGAYARGDLFEKRRRLMDDWAAFCSREHGTAAAVTPIRGTSRKSAA